MKKENSYKKCGICKQFFPDYKLVFNSCINGRVCLDCYKNQFPKIPLKTISFFKT